MLSVVHQPLDRNRASFRWRYCPFAAHHWHVGRWWQVCLVCPESPERHRLANWIASPPQCYPGHSRCPATWFRRRHSGSCLRAGWPLPPRLDSRHPCFPLSLFSFLLSFFIIPSPFSLVVHRQMGLRLKMVVLVVVMALPAVV